MNDKSRQTHWDDAYSTRGEGGVSWFEETPAISLDLIHRHGASSQSSLIDIGGGASKLVDALLGGGIHDITVLDLSPVALDAAKARLGAEANKVEWIASDVVAWRPSRTYDFWHDRATFHFLTEPEDRAAYVATRSLLPLRQTAPSNAAVYL